MDIDLGVFGTEFSGKTFPGKERNERTPAPIQGYAFRKELLRNALLWMAGAAGKSLYLAGPAGSGKTSLAEQVAARLGWACTTLSCNARTEKESRRAQQAYSRVHARSALRCRPSPIPMPLCDLGFFLYYTIGMDIFWLVTATVITLP